VAAEVGDSLGLGGKEPVLLRRTLESSLFFKEKKIASTVAKRTGGKYRSRNPEKKVPPPRLKDSRGNFLSQLELACFLNWLLCLFDAKIKFHSTTRNYPAQTRFRKILFEESLSFFFFFSSSPTL